MKYKDKDTGKFKTLKEIEFEHNEIINNNSYADEDIEDIIDLEAYIKMFYVEDE